MPRIPTTLLLGTLALLTCQRAALCDDLFRDTFGEGHLNQWRAKEGTWHVRDGRAVAESGFAMLVQGRKMPRDVEVSAEVAYDHSEPHTPAGIAFRFGEDSTGYLVCIRDVEKAVHPEFGPWERPVLQLFRLDRDGWKLLQESKVMGCRAGLRRHLKVVCRGPNIWVFYED